MNALLINFGFNDSQGDDFFRVFFAVYVASEY